MRDKGKMLRDNWRKINEYGIKNSDEIEIRLSYDFEKKAKGDKE